MSGCRPSAHLSIALALLACANVQPPPGGPPDALAPDLVTATPESLAILPEFDDEVEFRFSEVVSEGSQPSQGLGTGDLEKLVILSPTDRIPEVHWRRRRITVRPAEGWQPNRVYRVELLPGITDVRRNRANLRRVVTFTTGAPLPTDSLSGTVIDWKAGRPAPGALVEAVLEPDSLVYRAVADSAGRFRIGPLPKGRYMVYGVVDGNSNRRRETREAFDSLRVASDSGVSTELYAFVHDTLPPRIQTVTSTDSVTATITFATSLDPTQRLDTSAVTLRTLPDSNVVGVRALRVPEAGVPAVGGRVEGAPGRAKPEREKPGDEKPGDAKPEAPVPELPDSVPVEAAVPVVDSIRAPAPADSARIVTRADTGRRRQLNDRLILEAAKPWKPGDRLLVEIRGVRTVSGITGDVRAPLVIADARAPARPAKPGAADTIPPVEATPDTIRPAPPER